MWNHPLNRCTAGQRTRLRAGRSFWRPDRRAACRWSCVVWQTPARRPWWWRVHLATKSKHTKKSLVNIILYNKNHFNYCKKKIENQQWLPERRKGIRKHAKCLNNIVTGVDWKVASWRQIAIVTVIMQQYS